MGKASSAKKVARVARASGGSRRSGQRRNVMFPAMVGLIVVIGTLLVVFARSNQQATAHPQIYTGTTGDHWHAAYGIYICDHFTDALTDGPSGDQYGIHTHGDGVIHIHPFQASSAGTNAQLGVFLTDTDTDLTDTTLQLADGTSETEGKDKCNGKAGQLEVAFWNSADDAAAGKKPTVIYTSGFAKIRFKQNLSALTIAFLPAGAKIPAPTSIPTLHNLSDVPGATSSTTGADQTTTTAAGDTSSTEPDDTTTTVAGATTSTTAATTSTSTPGGNAN